MAKYGGGQDRAEEAGAVMAVLIKGMKMPTSCAKCILFGEYGCPFIGAVGYALTNGKRNEDCPLVPVQPHGRLIDADWLLNLLNNCMFPSDMVTTRAVSMATNWIKEAPTIIEAEDGE